MDTLQKKTRTHVSKPKPSVLEGLQPQTADVKAKQMKSVIDSMLAGLTDRQIIDDLREVGVPKVGAKSLIAEAKASIEKVLERSVKTNASIIVSNLYVLYRRNLDAGDLAEARKCLMDLAKLFKLTDPETTVLVHNNTVNINPMGQLTPEQLVAILRAPTATLPEALTIEGEVTQGEED